MRNNPQPPVIPSRVDPMHLLRESLIRPLRQCLHPFVVLIQRFDNKQATPTKSSPWLAELDTGEVEDDVDVGEVVWTESAGYVVLRSSVAVQEGATIREEDRHACVFGVDESPFKNSSHIRLTSVIHARSSSNSEGCIRRVEVEEVLDEEDGVIRGIVATGLVEDRFELMFGEGQEIRA
jgi:hypothetical protein